MPKEIAPISFTIKQSKRTKQFHCVVKNEENHEPTLTGEPCKNRADVGTMIANHIEAIKQGRFAIVGLFADPKPAKKKPASRRTTKVTS
jgi:hypothetical protein